MTDGEITALFFARSESAVSSLQEKYGALMRSIAGGILSDPRDAEECVAEACLAVWNRIPPESPNSLMAFTAKITRNLSSKTYHRNTAVKRGGAHYVALEELAECLPSKETPETELAAAELTRLLNRFLSEQTHENRVIFMRRYWFSESAKKIAKRLGMKEGAVLTRLSRLRQKFGKYLEKEEWFA